MATTGKRLYRSRTNRMLGGVCGGLAEYTGMDATVVRVIAVLLIWVAGGGIISYLLAWFIIPEAPEDSPPPTPR